MDYKENPDRCFYVSGLINDEMVTALLPSINSMRVQSNDPITVYIDSNGGDIFAADVLRSLATAPDPNGNTRELVTVSIGTAASAAADLLAHGDHAIAYEHTLIVYHGTRQNPRSPLTSEDAISLASRLRQTNENFAMRLARRSFRRLLYTLSTLDRFADFKDGSGENLPKLIDDLSTKLSPSIRMLVTQARAKCEAINHLTELILKKIKTMKPTTSEYIFDKTILTIIADYKHTHHKKDVWSLSGVGLDEIVEDFRLFHDFHFGTHNDDREMLTEVFGAVLLSQAQRTEYAELKKLTQDETKHREWILKNCRTKMEPLWYFAVSLARVLQTADFVLTAQDAFWLGIVDEVPGSGLIPLRQLATASSVSSNAPSLPKM
jgi:ATP-dependent protease ClpP protease subunit